MKKINFIFAFFLTLFLNESFGQPGALDNSFDSDGKLITTIGTLGDQAFSIAVQTNGKIVVAGGATSTDGDFAIVRYNEDGSLDNSFGTDGIVITPIGTGNDIAKSVVIQPDGNIVVAGYSSNGSDNDFALARYNTNGELDNTFGTGGKLTTPFGWGDDYGLSVALQSDGKIVVAGYAYNGNDYDFAVARYNVDGTLDTNFGTGGQLLTPIGSGNDYAYSVAIQSDSKIVLSGASHNGTDIDFALARFLSDGTLDTSFGTSGEVTTAMSAKNDFAYSVFIQPDGQIVVGGISSNGTDNDFGLARYNTDGTLDSSFGGDGEVITPIGNDYDYANAITLQADGKIIAAGDFNNGSDFDFAIARYNTDGTLDSTFDADGKVTTSMGTGYDYAYAVSIQPDGKIVVAGSSESGAGSHFAVARYISDFGTAITDFSCFANSVFIYPNPVSQTATIKYTLQNSEAISIWLLDVEGRTLATFINNEIQESGKHKETILMPEGIAPGFYNLVISSANGSSVNIKIVN